MDYSDFFSFLRSLVLFLFFLGSWFFEKMIGVIGVICVGSVLRVILVIGVALVSVQSV
jgi:hypothetical protein